MQSAFTSCLNVFVWSWKKRRLENNIENWPIKNNNVKNINLWQIIQIYYIYLTKTNSNSI